MELRDFGPYGIIFMTAYVFTILDFPVIYSGQVNLLVVKLVNTAMKLRVLASRI
jgi:hypothetical protein